MKTRTRDFISAGVLLLIAVPYVGYLINGEMPFIEDPRGMAATGLILGTVAYLIALSGDDEPNSVTDGIALFAGVLGIVAVLLAETAAAEVLLAVFMVSILVALGAKVVDHQGVLHIGHHPTGRA